MDIDVFVHMLDHHVCAGDEHEWVRWSGDDSTYLILRGEFSMPLSKEACADGRGLVGCIFYHLRNVPSRAWVQGPNRVGGTDCSNVWRCSHPSHHEPGQ